MNISRGYCADLNLEMYLYQRESKTVSENLGQNDQVVHMARQRRLSGAVISPAVVVLTSKNIIIVNRLLGGVRSDITFISHQDISSLRIAHGIIFSSVFVRIRGAVGEVGRVFKGKTEEGEINGLRREDAEEIFRKLNEMRRGSGSHNMQNFFVYGQVVNNYYASSGVGGWAWPADSKGGDRLYAPLRLTRHEDEEVRPDVQDPGTGGSRPLLRHQVAMLSENGATKHMVKADDLLIFKLRKEHADRYLVIP